MGLRAAALLVLAALGAFAVYQAMAPASPSQPSPPSTPMVPQTPVRAEPAPKARPPVKVLPPTAQTSAGSTPPTVAPPPPSAAPVARVNAPSGGSPETARTAPDAAIEDAAPPSTATLDKEEIQLAIKEAIPAVKACFQDALDTGERFGGKLKVRFTVIKSDGEGRIDDASILDDGVERPFFEMCVLTALGKTSFPMPEGEGKLTVTYPFLFASPP